MVSQEGHVATKGTLQSNPQAFREEFCNLDPSQTRVALEANGNWYWAADVLEELGLETHLANPHKVRLIAESTIKTDTVDATALANLLRMGRLPENHITPTRQFKSRATRTFGPQTGFRYPRKTPLSACVSIRL